MCLGWIRSENFVVVINVVIIIVANYKVSFVRYVTFREIIHRKCFISTGYSFAIFIHVSRIISCMYCIILEWEDCRQHALGER